MSVYRDWEKQHKSYMGTEALIEYGGFIKEALTEVYKKIYEEPIIDITALVCGESKYFCKVAGSMKSLFDREEAEKDYGESYFCCEEEDREYYDWLLVHMAKDEYEYAKYGPKGGDEFRFCDKETKEALMPLSHFDRKLIMLRYGLLGQKKMYAEEIAEFLGASGEKEYLEKRLRAIEKRTGIRKILYKDFYVALTVYELEEKIEQVSKRRRK